MPDASNEHGVVRGIAYRPAAGAAMIETDKCTVVASTGIDLENRSLTKRGLTLLSLAQWDEVCRELGVKLPWHTRRANLLIEGLNLGEMIGREVTVGPVRLVIMGETKPCGLMDKQHQGLRSTLVPDLRGGVYGQVQTAGTIHLGDEVQVAPSPPRSG